MSSGEARGGGRRDRGVGGEGSVDNVGEASFEGSDRFFVRVAHSEASIAVVAGGLVTTELRDRDAVDRGVELPIPDARQPVAWMVARPHRQRGGAVVAGVGVFAVETRDVSSFTNDLGGGEPGNAGDLEQFGAS